MCLNLNVCFPYLPLSTWNDLPAGFTLLTILSVPVWALNVARAWSRSLDKVYVLSTRRKQSNSQTTKTKNDGPKDSDKWHDSQMNWIQSVHFFGKTSKIRTYHKDSHESWRLVAFDVWPFESMTWLNSSESHNFCRKEKPFTDFLLQSTWPPVWWTVLLWQQQQEHCVQAFRGLLCVLSYRHDAPRSEVFC